jgi:nucleotide-binding universal stress UspA family protein
VKAAANSPLGVPPIEVYKVGDAYFVKDGHHRVSVARSIGAKYIQAHVMDIQTKVKLTSDISPEELILKAEYVEFLSKTRIDELLPDADLRLTVPGSYQRLFEHIQVHHYFMGMDLQRKVTQDEAILHWYNEFYLPIQKAISDRGILKEFPGRTETDLYLWTSDHRFTLEKEMGWRIRPEAAAADLARRASPRLSRILGRITTRLIDFLIPNTLETAPAPGLWRKEKPTYDNCLFRDILVPVNGEPENWNALEQAFIFSRCEGTNIQGLHVISEKSMLAGITPVEIRSEFQQRCERAGIQGGLAVTEGEIARQVCDWARFSDLVVIHVAHPPADQLISRLSSGLRMIIAQCPRPILAVPGQVKEVSKILLAFDGSPRSKEALYVSVYLSGIWNVPLVVLTAEIKDESGNPHLSQAKKYLEEHGIDARYAGCQGEVADCILETVREENCDLILMGGYGYSPVVELMRGSTVDKILRTTEIPVLICQ